MFSKTPLLLAVASLALWAAAMAPASANYDPCYENPAGKGCPGEISQESSYAVPQNSKAEQETRQTIHHHG